MGDLFSLDGKVIVITGATRGLGWAMAQSMAAAGGHVVVNGRNPDAVTARVCELQEAGHAASAAVFDVTDPAASAAALGDAADAHGGLDVLVNNAANSPPRPVALDKLSDEHWAEVIDTNLTACVFLSRAAARLMIPRGSGRIIMISSLRSVAARPNISIYSAAKAGLNGLTWALAVELGPRGITCNAIAPGFIATEATDRLRENPEQDSYVTERTPLGRWGRPEEIGSVAVFLASEAASFVNGHVLFVDGGKTIAE